MNDKQRYGEAQLAYILKLLNLNKEDAETFSNSFRKGFNSPRNIEEFWEEFYSKKSCIKGNKK